MIIDIIVDIILGLSVGIIIILIYSLFRSFYISKRKSMGELEDIRRRLELLESKVLG